MVYLGSPIKNGGSFHGYGYISHNQRVNPIKPPLNHHFPMVFLGFSYGFPRVLYQDVPELPACQERHVERRAEPARPEPGQRWATWVRPQLVFLFHVNTLW